MWRLLTVVAALLLPFSAAEAHLLPKQNATMNIVGSAVFCVVSVPVSALTGVDDDGNGLLSAQEIQRHTAAIQSQFEHRFHVRSAGVSGVSVFTWLVPPQDDQVPHDADYVVILHRANFAIAPTMPMLETDLFGTKTGEGQMTITVTRAGASDVAILTPGSSTHTFFRGWFATFVDFIGVGATHIWGGADHLLFLLTIVVAAAGWRYWFAVVSSFTVAHSITLSLSALNLVRIPPGIVEPGIAASIVAVALLNLLRRDSSLTTVKWSRVGVVFACGLLHGFGFASAIGAMSVSTSSRIATLAGFNVGIELGQFLFVGIALLAVLVAKRVGGDKLSVRAPMFASGLAAALGVVMLAQRLPLH